MRHHDHHRIPRASIAITRLNMVRPTENITSASIFAPSPPLSASDCDRDAHLQHATAVPHPQGRQARTGSSPCSFDSNTARAPITSVASSALGPKEEEETIQTTEQASDEPPLRDRGELETAISLIKASWQGQLPDDLVSPEWRILQVPAIKYSDLCRLLEDHDPDLLGYFEDKIRCDYDPVRAILILRLMATTTHEVFQDELHDHIRRWLSNLSVEETQSHVLGYLASDIRSKGHAKLHLDSAAGESWKSPDGQLFFLGNLPGRDRPYQFEGSHSPQFVSEIGYSQKARSLEDLAQAYYEDSNGMIKTVLTFDIEYASKKRRQAGDADKTAVLCLYRGPRRIHANVPFRDAEGNPVAGSCLGLFLSDFVPDVVLQQLSRGDRRQAEQRAIDISSQQLCHLLSLAEQQQQVDDKPPDPDPKLESGPSKKRNTVQWAKLHADDDRGESGTSTSPSESPVDAHDSSRFKRRKIVGTPDRGDTMYRSSRSRSRDHDIPRMQTRSMSRSGEDA